MTTIKELLPISNNKIGEEEVNAISARDLHKFLGVTERFQQWINKQLSFGFEENIDFVGCKIFNTLANLELQDYCLSLDCAKQVAMMQRNEKGTEARKYFIECEKQLKQALSSEEKLIATAVLSTTYEVLKVHLKWTQKGRLFIYELLKSRDILPVCEQPC